MKIDIELKDKIQAYISKRYFINDDNLLIVTNSNDCISPKMLYNDVLAIFGVDWDFTYYIVYEWLFVNEMNDIAKNWELGPYSQFRAPGIYTHEVDLSHVLNLTGHTEGYNTSYSLTGCTAHICFTGSTNTGPANTPIFISSKKAADGIYR